MSIVTVTIGTRRSLNIWDARCQRSDLSSDVFNTRKANKETLCEWLSNADDLVEQYETDIQHLLSIVDKSKSELIVAQQKVVNLQEDLLGK